MVKALLRWKTIRYTFNDVLEKKYMYMYVICRNLQYIHTCIITKPIAILSMSVYIHKDAIF